MPAAQAISELFGALAPILKIAFMPIGAAAGLVGEIATQFKNLKDMILGNNEGLSVTSQILAGILGAATAYSAVTLLTVGYKKLSNAMSKRNLAMDLKGVGAALAQAAGFVFKTFSNIPFGLGIPLAIAAVGGMTGLAMKAMNVGDMGIDPNGGPIVTSPKLGGIFQGKKQDGLSMGPGMGTDPSTGSTDGGGSVSIDYQRMAQAIVKAMAGVTVQSAPIQIGAQVINAISDQIDVNKSYK